MTKYFARLGPLCPASISLIAVLAATPILAALAADDPPADDRPVNGPRAGDHGIRWTRWLSAFSDQLQVISIVRAACRVVRRNFQEIFSLLGSQIAHHLGGRSQDESAVGEDLALGDDGPGAHQAAPADDGRVQHHGLNADERAFAHGAAV